MSLIQLTIFSFISYHYFNSPLFLCLCKKLHISFPFAKASAFLININLFLLLISQVKYVKKKIFLPFSIKNIHYCFVFYIYLWSFIHLVCHYINFYKLNSLDVLFSWGVGFTGHMLSICLFLFFIFSLPYFKKNKFHVFISMHYTLTFTLLIFSSFHGAFCFLKPDPKSNTSCFPTTWLWIFLPVVFILFEIIIKYSSKKYKIHNVISYPGNIYEIQLNLPDNYCGKTIHICCPDVSLIEWHPFSVSHSNKNGLCSVFIKIRGNWTKKFSNLLGITNYNTVCSTLFPTIYIDGPFHSLPTNTTNLIYNATTVFISSGIGLTTFQYLLNFIVFKNKPLKNMHFIIICKTINEIEWCIPLLLHINNIPNFNLYLFFTSEKNSHNKFINISLPYSFGRPNFESIFNYVNIIHDYSIGYPIVFFSGKHSLLKDINIFKNKYISKSVLYEL